MSHEHWIQNHTARETASRPNRSQVRDVSSSWMFQSSLQSRDLGCRGLLQLARVTWSWSRSEWYIFTNTERAAESLFELEVSNVVVVAVVVLVLGRWRHVPSVPWDVLHLNSLRGWGLGGGSGALPAPEAGAARVSQRKPQHQDFLQ